ncbi:hypothetical protein M3210_00480 [Oceanobacillus luteolus]|uniref:YceG-like family protein n=1 Tax=Oceanobacillus luteolus TaxID=1274358 RepID=A0ABW4HXX8_9BACI|nr:hypothetical protein [Oceanobacillus luteolus]MCM3738729.1 hypothetical protein [Oceanobacillus luteolus]
MKHTMRAFSVGLVTAGLILLGVFYFTGGDNSGQADLNTEEMITKIEEDGYRVITEEEYISYSVASTQQDNSNKKNAEETVDDEDASEEDKSTQKEKADSSKDDKEKEKQTEKASEKDNDKKEDKEKEQKEKNKEKQTASTVTFTVEPGMASSQISDMLEDLGIIEDAKEFSKYLDEHDYSLRIQMGSHELETGMSHYEIAERLTN